MRCKSCWYYSKNFCHIKGDTRDVCWYTHWFPNKVRMISYHIRKLIKQVPCLFRRNDKANRMAIWCTIQQIGIEFKSTR